MQRDAVPKSRKNSATSLPSMLLGWYGANAPPDPRGKSESKKE
jgi:hypothetical protein